MNKSNSIRATDKRDLFEQTKFRLDKISKIENYFIEEIHQRTSFSQQLNKHVTTFDYIDQIIIVLSATTGGLSLISFTSFIGASVGIANASGTLTFSLKTGIVKKLLSIIRKKTHDKILMLAKSKLSSIETLISQALIDLYINHEEFVTILKQKDRYEIMKDNLRNKNRESYGIMTFNSSVKSTSQKNKKQQSIIKHTLCK